MVRHKVKITLTQKSNIKHQCQLCQYNHAKLSVLKSHYKKKHGVDSEKFVKENLSQDNDEFNDDFGSDPGTSMQGNRDDDFTSLNCDDYEMSDEEEN